MRHETPPPPGPEIAVEEVPYDAVHELRVAWHGEDFPDQDAGDYHVQAREVALRRQSGSSPCTRAARRSPSPSSSTTATPRRSPRSSSTPTTAAAGAARR